MMYVLSAEFIVIMEAPRDTAIWLDTNADLGANPRAVPKRATRQIERKDFMVVRREEKEWNQRKNNEWVLANGSDVCHR
jgi:hypothetical protein